MPIKLITLQNLPILHLQFLNKGEIKMTKEIRYWLQKLADLNGKSQIKQDVDNRNRKQEINKANDDVTDLQEYVVNKEYEEVIGGI